MLFLLKIFSIKNRYLFIRIIGIICLHYISRIFLMLNEVKSSQGYLSKYYMKKIIYKFLIYYGVFIGIFTIVSFIDLFITTYNLNTLGLDKYFIILLTYPLFIVFVYVIYLAFFPIFLYEPSSSFVIEILVIIVLSIALKQLIQVLYDKIMLFRDMRGTKSIGRDALTKMN